MVCTDPVLEPRLTIGPMLAAGDGRGGGLASRKEVDEDVDVGLGEPVLVLG